MPAAILFDLDETLLDRTASLKAFLADQYSRFRTELGAPNFPVWRDRFLALDKRGSVHKSLVYPALLVEFSGNPHAAAALLDDYRLNCSQHARAFPGTVETLEALRLKGFRLGIISNGETEFQNRHVRALGLHDKLDAVLISEKEGLRKPDAAIFQRAAEYLGAVPADCLFVGDNPEADIAGAQAAGMRAVWFSNGAAWPEAFGSLPCDAIARLPELLDLLSA